MMIRKPSVERNKNSCIEYYDLLNNMFIEIIKLENEILANREKIDILIYNIISQENNCSSRNNYLNVKRNVYNNVSYKYEDARIELLENRDIYEDYLKRELLTKKKDEAQETINKIDNIVRENIQCMCGNDEFLLKIKAANYAIYRLVNENRFLTKKNHYLTILKYIYKQENCCTPSSLWSGVAFVGKGGENQIYGEVNTHKKKYQNRENKLKDLNHNHKVYVNLTLWYSGGKYYYYKFEENCVCKCAISGNFVIDLLYKEFRKRVFTINELMQKIDDFNLIKELIVHDILRYENEFEYGCSGIKCIKKENIDSFEIINLRYRNEESLIEYKEKIKDNARKGYSIYKTICDTLYGELSMSSNYLKVKQYIKESPNRISLLDFIYCDFEFASVNVDTKRRTWKIPRDNERRVIFDNLCKLIEEKIKQCGKIVYISENELINYRIDKESSNLNMEVVYQYDFCNDVIIPEMLSIGTGRFLGRYYKLYPEKKTELYKSINKDNYLQVNIEINSLKDNIGYNNPYAKKRLCLFDVDEKTINETEELFFLDDIYLGVTDDRVILENENGEQLDFYCASSLSPNYSKIYQLLCLISNVDDAGCQLGGTAYTRLELNKDYQPRIVIGNLLISRERFRVIKDEVQTIIKKGTTELIHWQVSMGIPFEAYIYTDINPKPMYIRFGSSYDLSLLKKYVMNANKYIYFEEVYPNCYTNNSVSAYNMEVMMSICQS